MSLSSARVTTGSPAPPISAWQVSRSRSSSGERSWAERRSREEFFPGFRNSIAAYTVSLLNPKVIADLRLAEHGLKIVERRAQNFVPALDGRYLLAAEGCTGRNVAKFSRTDGERYDAFNRELDTAADLLRELILQAPPNLIRGVSLESMRELKKVVRFGNRIRRLSTESLQRGPRFVHQICRRLSRRLVRRRAGQGPGSASMPSSATMQVLTRQGPPTFCCTMPLARSTEGSEHGDMRSAAWERSRRPWRARPQAAAWRSRPMRPYARSCSTKDERSAWCSRAAMSSAPGRLPPTSIPKRLYTAARSGGRVRYGLSPPRCGRGAAAPAPSA